MRKKYFVLITVILLITPFLVYSSPGFCQQKEKEKATKTVKEKKKGMKRGVIGGVEGGVIKGGVSSGVQGSVEGGVEGGIVGGILGGVEGGVIGTIQASDRDVVSKIPDEDFIAVPMKVIELRVEHLEIHPTETIPLEGGVIIRTESGFPINYVYGSTDTYLVELELIPVIIEKKGIEIDVKIFQNEKLIKKEIIFTRNLEPFIVELLEKDNGAVKFVDRITPLITIIEPAKIYPWSINHIEVKRAMLLMREDGKYHIIDQNVSLAAIDTEGSAPFLYYYVKGKGIYVLSFRPFNGAEPTGVSRDNIIKIKHNGDYFEWIARDSILPEGRWLVWVRNNPRYDPAKDALMRDPPYLTRAKETFMGIASGKFILRRFFK